MAQLLHTCLAGLRVDITVSAPLAAAVEVLLSEALGAEVEALQQLQLPMQVIRQPSVVWGVASHIAAWHERPWHSCLARQSTLCCFQGCCCRYCCFHLIMQHSHTLKPLPCSHVANRERPLSQLTNGTCAPLQACPPSVHWLQEGDSVLRALAMLQLYGDAVGIHQRCAAVNPEVTPLPGQSMDMDSGGHVPGSKGPKGSQNNLLLPCNGNHGSSAAVPG